MSGALVHWQPPLAPTSALMYARWPPLDGRRSMLDGSRPSVVIGGQAAGAGAAAALA